MLVHAASGYTFPGIAAPEFADELVYMNRRLPLSLQDRWDHAVTDREVAQSLIDRLVGWQGADHVLEFARIQARAERRARSQGGDLTMPKTRMLTHDERLRRAAAYWGSSTVSDHELARFLLNMMAAFDAAPVLNAKLLSTRRGG